MEKSAHAAGFQSLILWQRAMEVVRLSYPIARSLPKEEQFTLANQIRRAAVSIPSNIAEGSKRHKKEFGQFLRIASGSAAELETQFLLSRDLYAAGVDQVIDKIHEVQKMTYSFLKKL